MSCFLVLFKGMEEAQPSAAVEEILEQPDRLKDLDLDAFADELARQGYGNKQITLYDIRDELINRFKDHRVPFRQIQFEEKFSLLTAETPETMFVGKMITCLVSGFAYRKPSREALDQANPVRNDDSNLWQCPFCLKDNFPDLSEVRAVYARTPDVRFLLGHHGVLEELLGNFESQHPISNTVRTRL